MSDSLKNYLNKNAEKIPQPPRDELLVLRERLGQAKRKPGMPWWQMLLPVAGMAVGMMIVIVTQQKTPQNETLPPQLASVQAAFENSAEEYVFETYNQFEEQLNESLADENVDGDIVFL